MFPTEGYEQFECLSCRAVVEVRIIEEPEKATYPTIEFCPCCGLHVMDLTAPPPNIHPNSHTVRPEK